MIIESDFYSTEAGRQHFTDQLTSIRYCVQETCNFDVLYAYLVRTAQAPASVNTCTQDCLPIVDVRQLRLQLRQEQVAPTPAQHPHGHAARGDPVRHRAEGGSRHGQVP